MIDGISEDSFAPDSEIIRNTAQSVAAGIIHGVTEDMMAPSEHTTRAQAAVKLKRLRLTYKAESDYIPCSAFLYEDRLSVSFSHAFAYLFLIYSTLSGEQTCLLCPRLKLERRKSVIVNIR
ncbi:S-layer homology domain-containing protein [Paenibacillus puerhi]|uniref:S-layer homology domain-containing protein n=1 Tax=Paenibacillus puerhi TaxID=2692622 RepID=UPI001358B7BC